MKIHALNADERRTCLFRAREFTGRLLARKYRERETKWEGISLISKLRGLLEMNAAFLWRVIVLVCNMVPQH